MKNTEPVPYRYPIFTYIKTPIFINKPAANISYAGTKTGIIITFNPAIYSFTKRHSENVIIKTTSLPVLVQKLFCRIINGEITSQAGKTEIRGISLMHTSPSYENLT